MKRARWLAAAFASLALFSGEVRAQDSIESRAVADGVYFIEMPNQRQFIGSNSGFVVFDEYVLVIDTGFPLAARLVVDAVKRVTDKPIRFVFDTHDHPDHCFGNGVFGEGGATAIAQAECRRVARARNPEGFAKQAADDAALASNSRWQEPTLEFTDRFVLDDGHQRVELIHVGPAHTPGDAVAWLPGPRVLFAGDVCVNGAHNYCGDGDTASWIEALERCERLAPSIVLPGHGKAGDAATLALQKRWFVELRAAVKDGLAQDRDTLAIAQALDLPWYREWTGVAASTRGENVESVYRELAGLVPPAELTRVLGLREGDTPTRDSADWTPPKKVIAIGVSDAQVAQLRRVAPGVEIVAASNSADAAKHCADADAVIGGCSREILEAGERLRWVAVGSAGVERYVGLEGLKRKDLALTNAKGIHGPPIAESIAAMLLALARGILPAHANQAAGKWDPRAVAAPMIELRGRTALVVGLGGIGTEAARLLKGLGLRVLAIKRTPGEPPECVDRLGLSADLAAFAAQSDVVVNALPLTDETKAIFDAAFFAGVKKGALFLNIGRGRSVDTAALVAALKDGRLGGAGLDVTDPEPLPAGHELWTLPNVIITPHVSANTDREDDRVWLLFRENLRRFAAGERLLNVVDKDAGY